MKEAKKQEYLLPLPSELEEPHEVVQDRLGLLRYDELIQHRIVVEAMASQKMLAVRTGK